MDGPQLQVRIRPSLLQRRLLVALHGTAAVAVLCAGIPLAFKLVLLLLLATTLWHECRRHADAARQGDIVLCCTGNEWRIDERGEQRRVELLPDSRVLEHAVVLRIRESGSRRARSLLLLDDSATADELRRLRVCLRLGKGLDAEKSALARPRWL